MKKFLALALALVMVMALAACGGNTSAPAASSSAPAASSSSSAPAASSSSSAPAASGTTFEKMTWKFACSATDNTCWADMGRQFGKIVSDATGGAVTVEVYAADQLTSGNQTEGIQGVIDGTIDLSAHSNIIYSSFDKRLNVVSLPFLFDSFEDVDKKLDGDAGKAVGKVVEDMGLHLLGIAENGFRHPTNNKHAIEKMSDMQGLKIRVAGSDLLKREYDLWGASVTTANWSEVYTGLQTGTYDGQENPLPTADGGSISDVNKYVTYWTGVYDCIFFTMNGELYNSLSPELQKIVDEAGQKAAQQQRQLERQGDQEVLAKWKAAGVTVTELTPEAAAEFKQAAQACYSEFAPALTQELIDAFTK